MEGKVFRRLYLNVEIVTRHFGLPKEHFMMHSDLWILSLGSIRSGSASLNWFP
jgi:hypothetical protein